MSAEATGGLRPVHLAVAGENRIEEMVSVLLEVGAKFCVVALEVMGNTWHTLNMTGMRGSIPHSLCGVAYLLAGRSLTEEQEDSIVPWLRSFARLLLRSLPKNRSVFILGYCAILPKSDADRVLMTGAARYFAGNHTFNDKFVVARTPVG